MQPAVAHRGGLLPAWRTLRNLPGSLPLLDPPFCLGFQPCVALYTVLPLPARGSQLSRVYSTSDARLPGWPSSASQRPDMAANAVDRFRFVKTTEPLVVIPNDELLQVLSKLK